MSVQSPISGVIHSVGDVAADVIEIAELQCRLMKQDLSDSLAESRRAVAGLLFGALLALAALPVLLIGLASLIDALTPISAWGAYLIVSGIALTVALVVCLNGYKAITHATKHFDRSSSELRHNLDWLKATVRREQYVD